MKGFNKMMNKDITCFFPLHLDSGNRGCEAIARGTIDILGLNKKNYLALSRDISYDTVTGLDSIVSYTSNQHNIFQKVFRRLTIINKSEAERDLIDFTYLYKRSLDSIDDKSITFITGGDMMCYGNNEVNYITEYLKKVNKKVVLWGCSIGEENITPEKEVALRSFDLITARESLTYDFLTNKLGLNNVHLFPDPAFVLKAENCNLPEYFSNECIGINISNFVTAKIDETSLFGKNLINTINYILSNTSYHIVFIPHVFWTNQDDRIVCNHFLDVLGNNERIHVLNTETMTYCQIRYAISQLKMFMGARTHAVISAYSMKVPTIALGYSIKSKGIAKDLFMPEYSVLDYRNLENEDELVERYICLQSDTEKISSIFEKELPEYINRAYDAKACVDEVIKSIYD